MIIRIDQQANLERGRRGIGLTILCLIFGAAFWAVVYIAAKGLH